MKNIQLALWWGAVLWAVHIGVLKALQENAITITSIAGTSVWAIIASLVAFGKTWEEIYEFAQDLWWFQLSSIQLSKFALLSNKKLGDHITDLIGPKKIEEADIPLSIITTNIETWKKVVLQNWSVKKAVMASSCIPWIFTPIKISGQLLVDGWIVENVPVSPLLEQSSDTIVAVDLYAFHAWRKPKNILEILINSFEFLMSHNTKQYSEKADIVIQPDLWTFNSIDPKQVDALIDVWYNEAIKTLWSISTEKE